jgi:putative effector of murein hydrolase LrgA (UPF0299 family)
MLRAITILLVCQLAGEAMVAGLGWPVPGPVVGMALLFIGLVVRGGVPENVASAADGLLGNLSLLFVPAGVGVMLHAPLLGRDWLAISVALIASTLATIAVTGWLMQRLMRRSDDGGR